MPAYRTNLFAGSGFPSCTILAIAIVLGLSTSGCDNSGGIGRGVVGMFGETGLGWGDFLYPRAITASPENKIFVADKSGRIQRFDADGKYEAGWWMPDWKAGKPIGLTVHPDGRLFIADTHYSRVMIFDQDGILLESFGEQGDGPGQFRLVTDVAIDDAGFIYVGEYGGNDRVSKFSPDLEFVRFIGAERVAGVRLSRPAGLAIDGDQTLWVADACNHRIVRFSLDGEYLMSFGSVGVEPGQLRFPYDIDVCRDGSLLVSEFSNNRLQWFDRAGKSLRIWGRGGRKPGELYSPWGATEAANGRLYVLDSVNNRVQIVKL